MIYEYDWYSRNEDDEEFKLTFEIDYDISGTYIQVDRVCLTAINDNSDIDPELGDYWETQFTESHNVFDLKQEIWDYHQASQFEE